MNPEAIRMIGSGETLGEVMCAPSWVSEGSLFVAWFAIPAVRGAAARRIPESRGGRARVAAVRWRRETGHPAPNAERHPAPDPRWARLGFVRHPRHRTDSPRDPIRSELLAHGRSRHGAVHG